MRGLRTLIPLWAWGWWLGVDVTRGVRGRVAARAGLLPCCVWDVLPQSPTTLGLLLVTMPSDS